jgi:endonuclease/exonuclease/phosphatase family metal-dependent hydrolase
MVAGIHEHRRSLISSLFRSNTEQKDTKTDTAATTTAAPAQTNTSQPTLRTSLDSRARFAADSGSAYRASRAQSQVPAPDASSGSEFQIGTYNIGSGNKEARKPENFEKTRKWIGEKVASGDIDVLSLQEVDRNTGRAGGKDKNVEVLDSVFRAELGPEWKDAKIERRQVDDRTIELVATKDGEQRSMKIKQTAYDENGNELAWGSQARPDIVRYQGEISGNPPKTYNVIYGESIEFDGGQYGNAVLLGPGHEPTRFARKHIGADPKDDEKRSALAVEVDGPGDKNYSVISAHLTSDAKDGGPEERERQYRAIDQFAEGFSSNPTLITGDFNSKAGGTWWHWANRNHYPSAKELGWKDPDPSREAIDRAYSVGDIEVRDRYIHGERGGSDHDPVTWNVTL